MNKTLMISIISSLLLLLPTEILANPTIAFIPLNDETINFYKSGIYSRLWLLILVIMIDGIIYKRYIDKPFNNLILASGIANVVSIIPSLFFGIIMAIISDQSPSTYYFVRSVLLKISENIYFTDHIGFYINLITVSIIWLSPFLLALIISVLIENWILLGIFKKEDKKNILKSTIYSNIASYIFLYFILLYHYYHSFSIYSPSFEK